MNFINIIKREQSKKAPIFFPCVYKCTELVKSIKENTTLQRLSHSSRRVTTRVRLPCGRYSYYPIRQASFWLSQVQYLLKYLKIPLQKNQAPLYFFYIFRQYSSEIKHMVADFFSKGVCYLFFVYCKRCRSEAVNMPIACFEDIYIPMY